MATESRQFDLKKLSLLGVIVSIGIVFGDIGTSPLYVMSAILSGGKEINKLLIYGSMSCIFWTLTLQTTVKYVLITLRADNKGEGGIFALFALMKRKTSAAAILTMIGGSALLADGVITPAITVTSSIEGLKLYNPDIPVIVIVILIFTILFFMQQYGTNVVGGAFGPIMVLWFLTLAVLGSVQLAENPDVLAALNPYYMIHFLIRYPGGFVLLGAVFLATTGAQALYSDLGHCGAKNIRVSWVFVKTALLLNYLGQCAWLSLQEGTVIDINPFYGIMPRWFLVPGILIATTAAIIASQALITGSFTLISEAVSLNFWPKLKILNPTFLKGQVYVPAVNLFLFAACSFVVIFFGKSSNMEAAYGLSITVTMIMTTFLLSGYFLEKKLPVSLILLFMMIFLTIEGSFLLANLHKFKNGGWFTLLLAALFFIIMYGWKFGRKLKNSYVTFSRIEDYKNMFIELSNDRSVPKTATNLVYIIRANNPEQIESKVIYSIFRKQPKRADIYWLLHVDIRNDPYTFEYKVTYLIPGVLIRVDFYLGFKVEPKINLFFKEVLEDLKESAEIKQESGYDSLRKWSLPADFQYILIDRVIPPDYKLSNLENITLKLHTVSRLFCISDVNALQLDSTNTCEEKVPITVPRPAGRRIVRASVT